VKRAFFLFSVSKTYCPHKHKLKITLLKTPQYQANAETCLDWVLSVHFYHQ